MRLEPDSRGGRRRPGGAADTSATRYADTLPCADCSGIDTELTVRVHTASGQPTGYTLPSTYRATRDGDRTFERQGEWRILRGSLDRLSATIYQLVVDSAGETLNYLRVSPDELQALDRQQHEIDSPFNLSLRRVGDATATAGEATFTEADSARPVTVRAGEAFTVSSTASNRSTGYGWSVVDSAGGTLRTLEGPAYAPDASRPCAGGRETWRVRAKTPGRGTLRFAYRRPFEPDATSRRRALSEMIFSVV